MIFFETPNFTVENHSKPFVPREEGGHIRISVKDKSLTDRTKLTPKQAIELMRLSIVVGEAFEIAMNKLGVPVKKINYQDMGNWAYKEGKEPFLHYHIFGRVFGAKHQPLPESVYLPDRSTGFYEGFTPLNDNDIAVIKSEIDNVFTQEKYLDSNWGL